MQKLLEGLSGKDRHQSRDQLLCRKLSAVATCANKPFCTTDLIDAELQCVASLFDFIIDGPVSQEQVTALDTFTELVNSPGYSGLLTMINQALLHFLFLVCQ